MNRYKFAEYIKLMNEVKPRHRPPNGHSIFNRFNSLDWDNVHHCIKCMFYMGVEDDRGVCDMNSCIHYTKMINSDIGI